MSFDSYNEIKKEEIKLPNGTTIIIEYLKRLSERKFVSEVCSAASYRKIKLFGNNGEILSENIERNPHQLS